MEEMFDRMFGTPLRNTAFQTAAKTSAMLPVDVIEDEFWIHQSRLEAHTFLVGGISVGNLILGGAGTLGVSVFDNRTGQELFLLNTQYLVDL